MDEISHHRDIDPQILFYAGAKYSACIGCIGLVMLLIYSILLLTNRFKYSTMRALQEQSINIIQLAFSFSLFWWCMGMLIN